MATTVLERMELEQHDRYELIAKARRRIGELELSGKHQSVAANLEAMQRSFISAPYLMRVLRFRLFLRSTVVSSLSLECNPTMEAPMRMLRVNTLRPCFGHDAAHCQIARLWIYFFDFTFF